MKSDEMFEMFIYSNGNLVTVQEVLTRERGHLVSDDVAQEFIRKQQKSRFISDFINYAKKHEQKTMD